MFTFDHVDRVDRDVSGRFRVWIVLVDGSVFESFALKFDHSPTVAERNAAVTNLIAGVNANRYPPPPVAWTTVMGQAAHDNLVSKNVERLQLNDGTIIRL